MRSIGPAVTREQSPAFLRNSNGRLDFPGPTQEASRIPRRNSRIPPQLEKNHVVPPSSQDEALSRYMNMRFATLGFPDSSVGKESTRNAGDPGLIPESGRSAGEG